MYPVVTLLCSTRALYAPVVIPGKSLNSFTALRSALPSLTQACHSFSRSQPEFHSSLMSLPCATRLSKALLYFPIGAHEHIDPHHLPLLTLCFPSADFFLRMHEAQCARRRFVPKGLIRFLPAIQETGPRATSFPVMHHLDEKLRRLELKIIIATTFGVAREDFPQHRIPSPWPDTIPRVLQLLGSSLFIAFKFPLFLPGALGTS